MESDEEKQVLKRMKTLAGNVRLVWGISKDLELALAYYLSQAYWMGKNDKS